MTVYQLECRMRPDLFTGQELIELLMKRTEPSAKLALTPPGCKLDGQAPRLVVRNWAELQLKR